MPKTHSDWPINLTLRVSVAQRDFLNAMSELHDVTPSEFVRGLLDAEAKRNIGLAPDADDAVALGRAADIVQEASRG